MMPRTGSRKGVKYALVAVSLALAVLVCLWVLRFLMLMSWFGEGELPPRSRIPDVPSGASVVEDGRKCGSGGCWWQLTIAPAAGQSPEDLARAMDLAETRRRPPTLLDPGFVYVWAHPRDGQLVIGVSYRE
ncbi:hypothetical protein [Actinoplanes teichomyceticus]|uniref:Uncharacterized protein n=1 Tax=Actinoplanes teichomyceticus TaxID=1867 RepID=A0A561WKG8_ACTTI|nr:hypothetical protein [Actinoplanes teichomyceticus]TWG24348.1 hypothetical protein FHX34_102902 [Actinoplanes teichomyceticus]GIF12800.1 hypothetical protein Ate01nite_28320 [Actinoplanes teichomyceticus]